MGLPLQGTKFSYNGFSFPANMRTKVTETPVMSEDGRVVKYSEIKIEVKWFVGMQETAPNGGTVTTDAYMENARQLLSKAGQSLVYSNKGFAAGSLTVNSSGPIYDVAMGPVPGPLTFSPLGGAPLGNIAGICEWSVTTRIPECTSAVYSPSGLAFTQFAYHVDIAIDEAGYSVITTTGNYEIPLSLATTNAVMTADFNWDNVLGEVPQGFRRQTRRTLSADRRRLDYTTTDTQQPGFALPPRVVKADVHQRIHMAKARDFYNWICTIGGSLQINTAIATKKDAWEVFYLIIMGRIYYALTGGPGAPQVGPPAPHSRGVVLIQNFEVDDSLFSDSFNFSLTYRIVNVSLRNILATSGMWFSIGTRWSEWKTSMAEGPSAARGIANYFFNPSNDTIIDICAGGTAQQGAIDLTDVADGGADMGEAAVDVADVATTPEPSGFTGYEGLIPGSGAASSAGGSTAGPVPLAPGTAGALGAGPPPTNLMPPLALGGNNNLLASMDPDATWLKYEVDVRYEADHHMVRHKPLTGTVTYQPPVVDPMGSWVPLAEETDDPQVSVSTDTPDILQQTARPGARVVLEGAAMRMGFPINPPRLIQYGGIDMTGVAPAREVIVPTTINQQVGVPINGLAWRIEYLLPTMPASIDTPANPYAQINGPDA